MIANMMHRLGRAFPVALLGAVVAMASSSAFAVNVEVGNPSLQTGPDTGLTATDYFTICRDKAKAHCFDVSVDLTWKDTAATKMDKLIKAINASTDKEKDGVKAAQAKDKAGKPIPDTVTITGAKDVDTTIRSKQFTFVVAVGNIVPNGGGVAAGGTTGVVGFQGALTGAASDGSVASFEADFAFSGVDDNVTLSYGDLATPTTDGLLTQLFGELLAGMPSQFQSDLSLDLADGLISFDFPAGAQDPSVGDFTDDTGVAAALGLDGFDVPEPPALPILAGGLLTLLAVRTALRRTGAERHR